MTKNVNVRRTITFRQIFICILVVLVAQILLSLFTASTSPKPAAPSVNPRSYQIQLIINDDAVIYDGERVVGVLKFDGHKDCQFNKLIQKDNE